MQRDTTFCLREGAMAFLGPARPSPSRRPPCWSGPWGLPSAFWPQGFRSLLLFHQPGQRVPTGAGPQVPHVESGSARPRACGGLRGESLRLGDTTVRGSRPAILNLWGRATLSQQIVPLVDFAAQGAGVVTAEYAGSSCRPSRGGPWHLCRRSAPQGPHRRRSPGRSVHRDTYDLQRHTGGGATFPLPNRAASSAAAASSSTVNTPPAGTIRRERAPCRGCAKSQGPFPLAMSVCVSAILLWSPFLV